jgi:hypothetical protein
MKIGPELAELWYSNKKRRKRGVYSGKGLKASV